MEQKRVVILGGGYAGIMSALRITGRLKGDHQITLINGSDRFIERIRLHEVAAGSELPHYKIPDLLDGREITFQQGWVTRILSDDRQVSYETKDGPAVIDYDYLVYALGSQIDTTRLLGIDDHAYTLNDLQVSGGLHGRLADIAPANGRLLIIGGGLTGIEAAAELIEAYPQLKITLATKGVIGRGLADKGRQHIRQFLEERGATLLENCSIARVDAGRAVLVDGQTLDFEACLWAGAFIASPLAQQSGLTVNEKRQLVVDERLRCLDYPEIIGAGDGAAIANLRRPIRMSCATGMPLGVYAGEQVVGELNGQPVTKPFEFAYLLQCISLGRRDGLIQFVRADDTPRAQLLTGRKAAWVKEKICRYTIQSMHMERRMPGSYTYFKKPLLTDAESPSRIFQASH